MIELVKENPEIASALIAAIVSLTVASTAGIYAIVKTKKRIADLKDEIIAEVLSRAAAEGFVAAHTEYVTQYNEFERVLIDGVNDEDGTAGVQHVVNFIAEHANPLILRYRDFLGDEIATLKAEFDITVAQCNEHFDPNQPASHAYAVNMRDAGIALASRIHQFTLYRAVQN